MFSQRDMEGMVNSTESRSEVDDIFETIDRLHHRAVTQLQVEYHDKEEYCLAQAPQWISLYVVVNGEVTEGDAREIISDDMDKYLKAEHEKMEQAVRAFEKLRDFLRGRVMESLGITLLR